MKINNRKGAVAVLILSVVFLPLLLADAAHKKDLQGASFTNPSYQVQMPEDWIKKPIKYEDWADKADIAIALEQDLYHAIIPLIQKYAKKNNLKIMVKEGTCGIAAGMLHNKTIDIGGFCCPPGNEDRLPGLKFHTLGIAAKAILIHPDNPIDNLTVKQVRDIFAGKIFRWSELKTEKGQQGPDWTIQAIGRFHCQKRPGHWRLILDNENRFSTSLNEVSSIPDMITKVASLKGAIGWEVLGMAEHYKDKGKVKAVKIDGYYPTDADAIASKKYPFYRTYNITTWDRNGVANPHAQKLVAYLLKEVEKLDPKLGFVPASRLRQAGWKFKGNELIGEPE
ncbi:MAG: hypothetical protein HY755_08630 [Nitrospirae bacterium]|nr:hypothetical protein [Nitrospirota bacterium]